ncbi:hypothetical protein tloyanaT_13030 [Thalassotalea loyana]|uniref:Tape measure protein N-terminal domain-containing protein n=1 Tax=Thalassotalea loyana TaxID=280483 RepID=A0ABQ6HDT6_9GAMM|nr:tape measure protein [Thalassotalea loyana]GLX85051.1 hypothetical protein tloyanaT_13030 [Thalassotalea loyana]
MSNYNVSVRFNAKTGKFTSDVKASEKEVKRLEKATGQATVQNKKFEKSLGQTNAKLSQTNKLAVSLGRTIGTLAAGFGAFQIGSSLVQELAGFQDIRTRLMALSESAEDYADKEAWLIQLAERHHKEINSLADGYGRLSVLVKEQVINDTQARDILTGLSNAASETGATNENLANVYYGLSQALGQGVVQMQELNQVTEPLPGLMSKLARAAGQETSAGLKKMVADGKISSELLGTLLVTALEDYAGAAERTADNINTKLRDIKREYQLLAVALEDPIDSTLTPTLEGISGGLQFLRENLDGVTTILGGALVVAAGHAVRALTAKTVAATKGVLADRAAAREALIAANAEIQRATAAKAAALGATQAAAAEARLTAARTAAAAATTRLAIASRGLAALSAVVGGLPGLLTIAAFSMYSLATSTDEAAEATKRLNDQAKELNPFKNYTLDQAEAALGRYEGMLDHAKTLAEETQQRYNNPFFKLTAEDVQAANDKVSELENTIKALRDVIGLKSTPEKGGESTKQADNVVSLFEKQRDNLKEQVALLGKTTELARVQYHVEQGKYKDLLPHQQQELLNQAKLLDQKRAQLNQDQLAKAAAEQLKQQGDSYLAQLDRKVQLTSTSSETAKLAYELEHGKLKGISEELRTQLGLLAEKADAQARAKEIEALDQQINAPRTAEDVENKAHKGRLDTLNNTLGLLGDSDPELEQRKKIHALIEQEHARHKQALEQIEAQKKVTLLQNGGQLFDGLAGLAKTFAGEQSGVYKAMFAASKAFAIAESIIKIQQGIATAASLPFPANIPAMATVAAQTAGIVSTIQGTQLQGQAHDGIGRVPAKNEGTWMLKRGEMVLNERQRENFEYLTDNIKSGGKKSGNNIINITNNINVEGGSADVEQSIELATERMRAELIEDFSAGGVIAQHMRAAS